MEAILTISKIYELLSVEITLDEGKAKDGKPKRIFYNVRQQEFRVAYSSTIKKSGKNPKEMLAVYTAL